MVPVSAGDDFIVSSTQVREDEVRLDLIYAWSVDEGGGDGDGSMNMMAMNRGRLS